MRFSSATDSDDERHALGVCLLAESYYPVVGGGEVQARLVAGRLEKMGVDIMVLTRRTTPDLPRHDVIDDVPVHRVSPSGSPRWGKYLMMPTAAIQLVARRHAYDVIYVCGYRTLGLVAVIVGRLCGKAVVLKAEGEGELSGSFVRDDERVRTHRLVGWVAMVWIRGRNRVLRRADLFVSISQRIRAEIVAGGVSPGDIQDIPNGVDLSRFPPAVPEERRVLRERSGLPLDRVIVCYSGKLIRYKGLELLLDVWRDIVARRSDAYLVLIGSGSGQHLSCEDALRAFVQQHGLDSAVWFTGYTHDVAGYLRCADLYVFPSEREGFPLGPLEALACGLPVVASTAGTLPEVIDERVGRLIAPGDGEGLRTALMEFLEDPGRRSRAAEGARAVAARYDIDRVAEESLNAFRLVMRRRRAAREPARA
jgi:glycosyltransferase involved in cell wall biosynthesis